MTSPHGEHPDLTESLRRVNDKEELGRHLTLLHEGRCPDLTLEALARAAFGRTRTSKRGVVRNWLKGQNAPREWEPLKALLVKLGATEEEITEFERAFERIEDRRKANGARATRPGGDAEADRTTAPPPGPEPDVDDGDGADPGEAATPVLPGRPDTEDAPAPVPGPTGTERNGEASVPEPTGTERNGKAPAPEPTGTEPNSKAPAPPARRRRRRIALVSCGVGVGVVLCVGAAAYLFTRSDQPHSATGDPGRSAGPAPTGTTAPRPASPGPAVTGTPDNRSPGGAPPVTATKPPAKSHAPTRPPTGQAPGPLPAFGSGTQLVSVESGLCVDAGVDSDDSEVYQWACADGAANQTWHLGRTGGDVYRIKDDHSGKCLGIVRTPERLDVVQTACTAEPAQRWRFKAADTGRYGGEWYSGYFINSRYGKCLTLSQSSHEQRADIGEWDCADGSRNQIFRVRPKAL
ncbi:RICIN domain-containing protein [Streptomyces sp. NA04227]|uniref:RICIN domain-containing protein n=1 Tax=Streptomyces sp. NA04227 TaxID=2742136 RepID=UPI00158FB34D|nr:RICIN domain-containing protein [Streptomyces sp. NA04227]QKW07860.1 RICIN domain-containing protein [Streptomyces sp. NA04227]